MNKIFSIVLFLSVLFLYSQVSANTFIEKEILGHKIKVIKYDLSSDIYDFQIGTTEDATDMKTLMLDNNGVTAINGVFFCPDDYTACGDKSYTINERYIAGEKIATYESTGDRVVFALNKENTPFLFQTDKINPERESEIYQGFANFPLLMQDGKTTLESYHDLGLINKKMLIKIPRNFICSDTDGKNIYFGLVYGISLDKMPVVLERLGCYNALNLDAGGSTGFLYNAAYIAGPGRDILDGIIIKRKGLDVLKISSTGKKLSERIIDLIQDKNLSSQIEILVSLDKSLTEIRTGIYENYTTYIRDESGIYAGYQIEINNLEDLKRVYLVNTLQHRLKDIRIRKQRELSAIEKVLEDLR